MILPVIRAKGKTYRKNKNVFARKAKENENIATITDDGIETTNTARAGDYIVKNQTGAGEMYILGRDNFKKRYSYIKRSGGGFSEYRSTGKIIGVEMNAKLLKWLGTPDEFKFRAPWGEAMIVKKDDFLVTPLDFSEVYRIARKEFFETYTEDK